MNRTLISVSALLLASSFNLHAAEDINSPSIGKRIVGGEEATQGDWPWISALVFTYDDIATSLTVGGINYDTEPFNYTPPGDVSGEVVDCGIGDAVCAGASGKVCLIERGEVDFSVKAGNCEAGGGVGAIIYNNVEGQINGGTLGEDFSGTIPVVAVNMSDGETLLTEIGSIANISVSQTTELQQASTCGGSFIGDRWVLTAAHCVDSDTSQFIKVNVGEYDLADGAENAIDVINIYAHGNYDDVSIDNDIALLELAESLDVTPVSLASASITTEYVNNSSLATVMGWGGREGYAPNEGPTSNFPDILHQVDLQLYTNDTCRQTLADSQSNEDKTVSPEQVGITDNMMCAGIPTGGKGSCQGDSGGPLVINTNEGYQQVGIVSWGYGCAAEGYPDVYTKTSRYLDWIEAISNGIAVKNSIDYAIVPTETNVSQPLELTNNSSHSVNLTFTPSSSDFTVDPSECSTLAAGASCELTVTYNSTNAGPIAAQIDVTSDIAEVKTASAYLYAQSTAPSSTLEAEFTANTAVSFYTGGDVDWQVNGAGGAQSGGIDDYQQSILLAKVEGAGTFTFEWSVSSEENVDDPSEPYDALYVYLNGELLDFISGEVEFESYEITLESGTNFVYWIYEKDDEFFDGQDRGYVRNVEFTGGSTTSPGPDPEPDTSGSSSSGGSTNSALLALLLAGAAIRRRIRK